MVEIDLVARMTLVVPGDDGRGGGSYAARVNALIRSALERDGFEIAVREGWAVPLACSTDVYRMEHRGDPDEDEPPGKRP